MNIQYLSNVVNTLSATCRAQKFPSAASFRISLSRARSVSTMFSAGNIRNDGIFKLMLARRMPVLTLVPGQHIVRPLMKLEIDVRTSPRSVFGS